MSFKLKALVLAAIAATTMSSVANALTNNEIFLIAYDSTANNEKTFVASLGTLGSVSGFNGTSDFSKSFAADSNWTGFYSAANSANITWQVLGVNAVGTGTYNAGDELLTTSAQAVPPGLPSFNNNSFNQLIASAVSGTGAIGKFTSLNSTVTGNTTALVLGTADDSGAAANNNFFTKYNGLVSTASLDTAQGFWDITRAVSSLNATQAVKTQFMDVTNTFADTLTLTSAGVLTYSNVAAVPEADSSAMILAGLGLMGFIARRRNARV